MMIIHPTLSKEIFLWRLQLLWTLVLTLTCACFIICVATLWWVPSPALQCRLYLQKFWIKAILINASPPGSIWMAEKRELSPQSYFAFLSHLGLSHDDLVCVKCKCKARQTERFQLRILELSVPTYLKNAQFFDWSREKTFIKMLVTIQNKIES